MPTIFPVLRGKFGRIEYWVSTIHIAELVAKIQMPQDMDGWDDLSIEDKYQREVNLARIEKKIAPYFAKDEDRFSGALVLAIRNPDNLVFESISGFSGDYKVPLSHQGAYQDMGFLTLSGEEMLVPIDGQHRAKAFKFAMNGKDDNGRAIAGIKGNTSLAKDQAAVILMRFDKYTSRRVFNKINRYAKPTQAGDNLITDDDDAVAVITRAMVQKNGVLPPRLVRLRGNTLSQKAPEFIPLATFYAANLAIAEEQPGKGKPAQMTEDQRELAEEGIRDVWALLLSHIDLFERAVRDSTKEGDGVRIEIRKETLLGKPIGQLALVRAFLLMRKRCEGVSDSTLCERLNHIDWRMNIPMWESVLVAPNGRVMSGKTTVNRAALFIAHLGGVPLTADERRGLLEAIHGVGWEEHELPKPDA